MIPPNTAQQRALRKWCKENEIELANPVILWQLARYLARQRASLHPVSDPKATSERDPSSRKRQAQD